MGVPNPVIDQRGYGEKTRWPGAALAVMDFTAFLAGVWLLLSPYAVDQAVPGLWSGLCAGVVLVVDGATPLVERRPATVWRPARLVIAAWLITAPFALGPALAATATSTGDVLVGGVVLVSWVFGAAIAVRVRRTVFHQGTGQGESPRHGRPT